VFLVRFPAGDTTRPVLSLPGDLTVDATRPGGARVSYTTTATDDVDGTVPVTYSLPSGPRFSIGTTTVSCSASDSAGNTAAGTFKVTVLGAPRPDRASP
jgi:HYR domain-containing protein